MKTPLFAHPPWLSQTGFAFTTNSATRYLNLVGQVVRYVSGNRPQTTEGNWRFAPDVAGAIDDLELYVSANTRTTAVTFDLMVNGVAAGLTWSVGAGVTGWVAASGGPVNVAEGDLLSVRMVTGTGGGSITIQAIQSSFTANSGETVAHFVTAGDYGFNQTVSTTAALAPIVGTSEGNGFATTWLAAGVADRLNVQFTKPGEIVSARADIPQNTSTAAIDLELYKNGVATGLKITVPAATTGRFRATGSVAVAEGDQLVWHRVAQSAGTGNYRVGNLSVAVVYDDDAYDVFGVQRGNETAQGYDGAVNFVGPQLQLALTTDPNGFTRFKLFPGTIEKLWANVNVPSPGAGFWPTCELRFNGSSSGLDLGVDGATTGRRYDENNVDQAVAAGGERFALAFQTNGFTHAITSWGFAVVGDSVDPVTVDVPNGALELAGQTPDLAIDQFVEPDPGQLELAGQVPNVAVDLDVPLGAGALEVEGQAPSVSVGVTVPFDGGELELQGQQPFVATDLQALATQQAVLVLGALEPDALASQQAALLLAEIVPDVAASQQAVLLLADGSPCVTERCQIWTITRRDGVVFRYTSHDRDLLYGGQVYSACRSLNPSASENASSLGSVGNIELEGIIDDDGISEADLYGGLFDDAYVTVDLISWGSLAESPRRLASGWTGELSQGDSGFRMEVLGAGARLDQQALVQMITPGCRWEFGSPQCGVDAEALSIGGVVTAAQTRAVFSAVLDGPDGGLQWANGKVRWTSGVNAGLVLEVKSVDFGSGLVTLWPSAAHLPSPGDAFDLLPGCDKAKTGGCTVYSNIINFGGFPDVPGSDAILETPDAKY